jgi:quercetin dioxygenase-like cupin family protein
VSGARHTPRAVPPSEVERALTDEGLAPRRWSNGPGDTYARHDHAYHKVLYCEDGSITFHTADGDIQLDPGDRLDIEPRTVHAATVGARGVTCVEGARS